MATASTTAPATSTTTTQSAAVQAQSFNALLSSSSAYRVKLQSAVDVVEGSVHQSSCGGSVPSAIADFQQVVLNRQMLLNRLASTSLSAIPNGQLAVSDLRSAWLMSERIDRAFEQWATIELNNGCRISDSAVPSYRITESLDPASTNLKAIFVGVWNPMSRQLNQPSSWTADQI